MDRAFEDQFKLPGTPVENREEVLEAVLTGGYPEILSRKSGSRRRAWFEAYLTTVLSRDVRDIANIDDVTVLPRLLSILAARAGGLLNISSISRQAGIPHSTLTRYLSLLETIFLVQPLRAWTRNPGKRLIKSRKTILCDTGLLVHLLGYSRDRILKTPTNLGPVLENFVVMELRKQISWSHVRPAAYHYRTRPGHEVDVILEDRAGRCVGIEVKASATVTAADFRGLRSFREATGPAFRRGIVLYMGDVTIPFGDDLLALPLPTLWNGAA